MRSTIEEELGVRLSRVFDAAPRRVLATLGAACLVLSIVVSDRRIRGRR